MKDVFREKQFHNKSLTLIHCCNHIVTDYQQQGLRLTLRQLYYQLVTKNIITNVEASYSNLSALVSDARLAGLIDWSAIEDRTRLPINPPEFEDTQDLVKAALQSYRLPRWRTQPEYIELWVEKDALAGVLRPIAYKYHITLMVNRGYSSQSAMYEAANRFIDRGEDKRKTILYLGDFDPSGEDMVRDIQDRMDMFLVNNLEVIKIALTSAQIKQYNPPPNPAKIKDPRAIKYLAIHGDSSWEVDAINPIELQKIITFEIQHYLDADCWVKVLKQEEIDKRKLLKIVGKI